VEIDRPQLKSQYVIREVEPTVGEVCLNFFDEVQAGLYRRGCYCAWYPFAGSADDWAQRSAQQNRDTLAQEIGEGRVTGFLAYVDGEPVGWCRVGAKADLPHARGGPYGRGADLNEIGAIVCFAVAPGFRRHGVATELMNAAVEKLRSGAFRYAEAYPLIQAGNDPQDYRGWREMFLLAGFVDVSSIGDRRGGPTISIVRKMLNPGPEWENNPLLPLRIKALYDVQQAYEAIASMATVRLATINRDKPRKYRYTRRSLLAEYTARAQAMNNFAVLLGLITGKEFAAIIRAFHQAHPDVWQTLNE